MLKIITSAYTNSGGHDVNEDSYYCGKNFFAAADGLGGHGDGEKASRCAIEYMKQNVPEEFSSEKIIELIEGANKEVCALESEAKTTIAAAFLEKDTFRYINVGDSRIYYFHNGRITAMSKDHSVCQAAVDMDMMKFEEIRSSPDRPKLLRVLGARDKACMSKEYPPIKMCGGDAFLICSDGFWEFVLETEMETDLLKSSSPQQWLRYMLKRVILRSRNNNDNYTAICGFISDEAAPEENSINGLSLLPIMITAAASVLLVIISIILSML